MITVTGDDVRKTDELCRAPMAFVRAQYSENSNFAVLTDRQVQELEAKVRQAVMIGILYGKEHPKEKA